MCHNKRELKSAIARYRKLQSQKVQLDQELESAKSDIFDYLDYNSVEPKEKVYGQNFVLSFSQVSRSSFDKALLVEALGEDLSPYQTHSEYRRLYIK